LSVDQVLYDLTIKSLCSVRKCSSTHNRGVGEVE
jgi:hypothetical protein